MDEKNAQENQGRADAAPRRGKFVYSSPLWCVGEDDPRAEEYLDFKRRNGFSPDECWSLKTAMAEFLLPRLEKFREDTISFPPELGYDRWKEMIGEFIWLMRQVLDEDSPFPGEDGYDEWLKRYLDAMRDFGKYWTDLWW